jgi:predicted flap endonuclease-1-like 5' DNA nuclease
VAGLEHRSGAASAPPSQPTIPRAPALPTDDKGSLTEQLTAMQIKFAAAKRDLTAMDRTRRALAAAESRVEHIEAEREAQRARAEKAERELARREEELQKREGQHESLHNLLTVRADRIRELEAAVEERERRLTALATRVEQLEARREAPPEPPPSIGPDDLQRIKGIGPAFARKLAAVGITRFEQIAGWTDETIDAIAEQIGVHGSRIRRADWRGSAAQLLQPEEPTTERSNEPAPDTEQSQSDDLNW